jgi:ankyrin repeat protein
MQKEFFDAVERNDANGLKELISGKSIYDIKDDFGYYLLHHSISRGLDPISEILIHHGVKLDARDKKVGQTALHYVAFYGNLKVAQLLLDKGADLGVEDNYGNRPLWTAVFNDKGFGHRLDIICLFSEHGADINHRNKAGKSALDFATSAGYVQVIALLK